jgi:hypothetical protein
MQAPTAKSTSLTLPTYRTIRRSAVPPVFDEDNVYPFSIYPFESAVRNHPQPELKDYHAIVIENGLLRVTVLPSLGGRIYQIEDVATGSLYLHENRCVRPTRVPPRWNFISLGIEHNFPYAHSPTGTEEVCYEVVETGNYAAAAVGFREPQWGLSWRTEVRLYSDFRGVVVSTCCWNDTDTARQVQWWSNCAQPGSSDVEFVFPNEPFVAHIDGEGTGEWPIFKGVDLRWHRTYDRMVGVFIEPTTTDWFGIYHHERGWGLLHLADPLELSGKKLWSFGNSGSTAEWSLSMTRDGSRNVEIQAGTPGLQSQTNELKPGAEMAFSEIWIPIDQRRDLDDDRRLTYAGCRALLGAIEKPVRRLPAHRPANLWDELAAAYEQRDEVFLADNASRVEGHWPPTHQDLAAPLDWAAASKLEAWMNARGVRYAASGAWQESLESFAHVLRLHERSFVAQALSGLILWKVEKRSAEAREYLLAALSTCRDGELFSQTNQLLREIGDLEGRERLLENWGDKEDERFSEACAELLLDQEDARACLDLLESVPWNRHHCRHRRTKLWIKAREVLGLPTSPIAECLKEDPYSVSR